MKNFAKQMIVLVLMLGFGESTMLACLDNVIRINTSLIRLKRVAIGQLLNISIPVLATSYAGEGGNGPINYQFSASADLSVNNWKASIPYGNAGQPGTLTLDATVIGNSSSTGSIFITPRCGTFPGSSLSVSYVFEGSETGGGVTTPAPWGHNIFTAGGGEPVSMATGELFGQWVRDLFLGGPAGFELRRYYSSYLKANNFTSSVGANWQHNFDTKMTVSGSDATLRLFGGQAVKFSRTGANWQLAGPERRPYQLQTTSGGGYLFYDPVAQKILSFDGSGALTAITDRNGNRLTVTQGAGGVGPTLVSDGLGRTLTFSYTAGALTRVTDQSGRSVSFENVGGNLTSWTDGNGKKTTFAYTTANNLTGLLTAATLPLGNKPLTQTYDAQGRVSTQTNSFGDAMTLVYSPTTNGATLTEPLGVSLIYAHDANLNLTSQSDPNGRSFRATYDANRRPLTFINRAGAQSSLGWDAASGLPSQYTDEAGNRTSYRYTASTVDGFTFHDLTGITYPDGTTISITRDEKGNAISMTDQAGRVWQVTRNSRGQLLTFLDFDGIPYSLSYASDGTVSSFAIAGLLNYPLSYDSAKRWTGTTYPDGTSIGSTFDSNDNLVKITNELNHSSSIVTNDNNRVRGITDALGATTSVSYDGSERVTAITDPAGRNSRFTYDNAGRLASRTDGSSVTTTFAYNTVNHLTGISDSTGKGLNFSLDAEGRTTGITDPLGRTISASRDTRGLVTSITTPNNERSALSYDSKKRLTQFSDALGRSSTFAYDPRGRLARHTMPGGIAATYTYDSMTDPNGGVWRRALDSTTGQIRFTDPLGRVTVHTRDAKGQVAGVKYPEGELKLSLDPAGNLRTREYSDGLTLNSTYDANNRLTTTNGLALSYDAGGLVSASNGLTISRDGAGRIASITYAAGKVVRYTYDNRGLLTQVSDWVGGTTAFTYDAARQVTSVVHPNGVREDYSYDANGKETSIRVSRQGVAISSIAMTRDALGRIISAERSAANIPDVPAGVLPLAYDAGHQSVNSSYDGRGRVIANGSRTYQWDGASRLKTYAGSDGTATFTYDGLGQRISRMSTGATQNYVLNYATRYPTIATVRIGVSDVRYYVWLPNGRLLSSIEANGNARRFHHFDESGSATSLTNDSGVVTDTYAITPFGETITRTGQTENPFTYHGAFGVMQEGETGIYYMRARYYDSAGARFLTRDPLPSSKPNSINPYHFVNGNPIERIDPAGLRPADPEPFSITTKLRGDIHFPRSIEEIREELFGQLARSIRIPPFEDDSESILFVKYWPEFDESGGAPDGFAQSFGGGQRAEALWQVLTNPLVSLEHSTGNGCGIIPKLEGITTPYFPFSFGSGEKVESPPITIGDYDAFNTFSAAEAFYLPFRVDLIPSKKTIAPEIISSVVPERLRF